MTKASRGCVQLLFSEGSWGEAIRTSITEVATRLSLGKQSIFERGIVFVFRLVSRKFKHGLESLRITSTAKATGAGQRRGLSLAVGAHRLGHCDSKSRIGLWRMWLSMRQEVVRPDAHNLNVEIPRGITVVYEWRCKRREEDGKDERDEELKSRCPCIHLASQVAFRRKFQASRSIIGRVS